MAHSASIQTSAKTSNDRPRTFHRRPLTTIATDQELVLHLPEALPVTEAEIDLVLGALGATIAAILGGNK